MTDKRYQIVIGCSVINGISRVALVSEEDFYRIADDIEAHDMEWCDLAHVIAKESSEPVVPFKDRLAKLEQTSWLILKSVLRLLIVAGIVAVEALIVAFLVGRL